MENGNIIDSIKVPVMIFCSLKELRGFPTPLSNKEYFLPLKVPGVFLTGIMNLKYFLHLIHRDLFSHLRNRAYFE